MNLDVQIMVSLDYVRVLTFRIAYVFRKLVYITS